MAPQPLHLPHIRVSDFDDWDLNDGVKGLKAFGDSIPGYHYGATFLTTLRSNLHLSAASNDTPSSSAMSTPTQPAFSPTSQPTPSPLSIDNNPSTDDPTFAPDTSETSRTDDIPPLTTYIAASEPLDEKIAALKLIADSVAQQRQTASRILITHPITVVVVVAVVAILANHMDLAILFTTTSGIIMAGLASVRLVTAGYIRAAESVKLDLIEDPYPRSLNSTISIDNGGGNGSPKKSNGKGEEQPLVIVTKFGEEIIGACVLRVVKRERKGYVRAWTVRLKFRRKGVGRGLLEEAVKVVWGRGGRGVEFEEGNAHSHRILPAFLNGPFDRNEAKAKKMLAEVVTEQRREKSSR